MNKSFFFVLVLVGLSFSFGCDKAPEGFPKDLVPCTVTVTDAGKPIPDATVNFVSDSVSGGVVVGGITDSTGKAVINTQHGEYKRNGAPQGSFKVAVSTPLSVDMPVISEEERFNMTQQQRDALERERLAKIEAIRIIPAKLSSPSKTPLTLDVGSGEATLDIDISQHK